MNVSLEVKLSNKPPVVVVKTLKTDTVESELKLFLPLKAPSLSTLQRPQAAQLVVAKHTQSFRCNSLHSFVSGRKVSHFEECAIFLHLNDKDKKALMNRIITQIFKLFFYNSPLFAESCIQWINVQ